MNYQGITIHKPTGLCRVVVMLGGELTHLGLYSDRAYAEALVDIVEILNQYKENHHVES